MRERYFVLSLVLLTALFLGTLSSLAVAETVPKMTTDELRGFLGQDNVIVLDVRSNRDWSSSKTKVAGAERTEPGQVNVWASNYDKEKTIVLYCA